MKIKHFKFNFKSRKQKLDPRLFLLEKTLKIINGINKVINSKEKNVLKKAINQLDERIIKDKATFSDYDFCKILCKLSKIKQPNNIWLYKCINKRKKNK